MEEYNKILTAFIKDFVRLSWQIDKAKNNEQVDLDKAEKLSCNIDKAKNDVVECRKALNLYPGKEDDFSFLENSNFEGFRIENCKIIGDQVFAYDKGESWYKKNSKKDIFFHDLGLFIYWIVDYEAVMEEKKNIKQKEEEKVVTFLGSLSTNGRRYV